ncbi:hypothetical protein Taro_039416 [Colocasia esculenta]|uniref:Aminotransferase-like plant mobile domain-containing protein n=1 Tax=Colocasia esculenta TaxID=4460 RepID=A0A843WIT9_COLES|nr:hypothetical protein [Colocasia esculenta]
MEMEVEPEVPEVNLEDTREKKKKAMKSAEPLEGECRARCPKKRGSDKKGFGPSGSKNAALRPTATPDVAVASNAATLPRQEDASRSYRDPIWVTRHDRDASGCRNKVTTRDRIEEMGFGEIFRMERMRTDPAVTQALRSRWDTEVMAFVFPWGHMIPSLEDVSRITGLRVYGRPVSGFTYPCYHDIAERLLELLVERMSSLIPRKALQEGLGLHDVARQTGDDADEYLEQPVRGSRRELASEPGPQADLDLRRFLILFLGRLLFATRDDAVHCRFLPLLEDLSEVGGYAWGATFLAHQFDSLGASERQTSTSGFYPYLQVWAYLHLPGLGRGVLERPGLVPIARRWGSPRDYRSLGDQLTRLQEMIDSYPYPDVVWQPYLEEGDEGQPQLVQARPYFGRSVWLHALNLVLPLNLFLCQRSLGLRQSAVEFSTRDQFRRPGRSFRGLHDTTDWCVWAQEQINNWERRGKAVKSAATTDDAYLQAYALKYGGKVYMSARHQVDVAGEIASLRALLRSATQRRELDRVRSAATGGASSLRGEESHQRELTDQLAAAVLRPEEAERDLADQVRELRTATDRALELQGQMDSIQSERGRLQGEMETIRGKRD